MDNPIDKVKNLITPKTPPTKASLADLTTKTKRLEQQAEYAETEAKLLDRMAKATNKIKATRHYPHFNIRYIVIGLVILVVIILIMTGSC